MTKTVSHRQTRAFTLVEVMIAVAIIGILATVVIPTYLRYIRQAKTPEAVHNVRKMYDGLVAYHAVEHFSPSGALLPRAFPADINWMPGNPPLCPCQSPGGKCNPTDYPTAWSNATFQALNFELHTPHGFSYGTEPLVGTGANLGDTYRVAAGADLDCNAGNGITYVFRIGVLTNNGLVGSLGMQDMLK